MEHLEKRRWFIALSVAGLCLLNNMVWLQFAPFNLLAQEYFSKSAEQIDVISLLFMGSGSLLPIPSSIMLDRWGMRPTLSCVALFNLLGCAVKVASYLLPPTNGISLCI
jgi:nitrate/nitrite transporter NarK